MSAEQMQCPNCHHTFEVSPIPPEPPIGTWVTDRYGIRHRRGKKGGWGQPGFYHWGRWRPMWEARGPLIPDPATSEPTS